MVKALCMQLMFLLVQQDLVESSRFAAVVSEQTDKRQTIPEDPEEEGEDDEPTMPPRPVCCGYRPQPKGKLSGEVRHFTKFKKKAAGKTCGSGSVSRFISRTETVEVDMTCCNGLEDEESQSVDDSVCLSNGAYSCEEWGAEKVSNTECKCPRDTTCVQTQNPEARNMASKFKCSSDTEWRTLEQDQYGLHCMSDAEFNCAARGAMESDKYGYCECKSHQVCVGKMCKHKSDVVRFKLAEAFNNDETKGGLSRRDQKDFGIDYKVGCVPFTCEDFNAEGEPDDCECPAGKELQEDGKKSEYDGEGFHVQEAWDYGYWCAKIPKNCPDGLFNNEGMPGRPEDELWCECPYRATGVDGCRDDEDCMEFDRKWFFNYDCKECTCEI